MVLFRSELETRSHYSLHHAKCFKLLGQKIAMLAIFLSLGSVCYLYWPLSCILFLLVHYRGAQLILKPPLQ